MLKVVEILNFVLHINREVLMENEALYVIAQKVQNLINPSPNYHHTPIKSRSPQRTPKSLNKSPSSGFNPYSGRNRGEYQAYKVNLGSFSKEIKQQTSDAEVVNLQELIKELVNQEYR